MGVRRMSAEIPEALLARACSGDVDALSDLLAGQRALLVRMVELRLEPKLARRLEPEDVVQQALLDAARRFPEWCRAQSYPLRVWLRLMTAQTLAEASRRHLGAQKRDAQREVEGPGSRTLARGAAVADFFAASQTSPSQAARRDELRARLYELFEEMDELDREILTLRHFEELSNEEAAAELGIEPPAASKRFVRALARLRPLLEPFRPDSTG